VCVLAIKIPKGISLSGELGEKGGEKMKHYKMPKKYAKPRKFNGKCETCGKPISLSEAYCYVDENNIAISWHAKYECRDCAEITNKK
jgi:hypothetical protein